MNLFEPRARFAERDPSAGIPIFAAYPGDFHILDRLPPGVAAFARGAGWTPDVRAPFAVRNPNSLLEALLFPVEADPWPAGGNPFPFGSLPRLLGDRFPTGRNDIPHWRIEGLKGDEEREAAALGWLLGSYEYMPKNEKRPLLACPPGVNSERTEAIADAVCLARRLVSAPANQLGPSALAEAARQVADVHSAKFHCIADEKILKRDWPLVHVVGRAALEAPRVAEIRWGNPGHPAVTLVGKGITFDTGGVNLKPSRSMRRMNKDMGGAATALALAHMIMACKLPIRLRVLLPIAENAVSSVSFRPGDVYQSRAKISVEIGNTDAEGRLVLADALDAAAAEQPDLLLDFATLTGAARVALGQEVPALFTDDDALAEELVAAGLRCRDPLWRLPLWQPYNSGMRSDVADVSSTGSEVGAGAITAALFLQRFVPRDIRWAHVDLFGWNSAASAGKPAGGECQAARACFAVLESRYAAS